MPKTMTVGANQVPIQGPATITHEGGDPLLIAEIENGFPGTERTLTFDGEDIRENFDDQVFTPVDPEKRSAEIGEAAMVRSLGQANVSITEKAAVKTTKTKGAEKVAA